MARTLIQYDILKGTEENTLFGKYDRGFTQIENYGISSACSIIEDLLSNFGPAP